MKKFNYKIIWVTGLFLTLILILIMVMTYKIKYEDTIYYKYLYIYRCGEEVCSTTKEKEIEDKSNIYSVYKYKNNIPTYTILNTDYMMLNDNEEYVLYDYQKGKIITKKYKNYQLVDNQKKLFITTNIQNKYGIIDTDANVVIDFIYDNIKKSYNNDMIVVNYNNKYGIITLDGQKAILDYIYDDIYIFSDVIITIENNLLSIIDTDKKKLADDIQIVNKDNLTINVEDNIINIKVNKENEFSEYKFDISTKKLL